MAEFHDLVEALGWLLTNKLQARSEYTHGLLGNGQGQTRVPDRPDYSWVRPDRFSTRVFEVFNKRVSGPDGMPVLIGELPWQPGLTQVIAVDWDTYIGVGWGDATPGGHRHGETHEWRDAAPSVDTFNVYRRQMAELKTQSIGSGSASVNVSAYNFTHFEDVKSWRGQPGLDLSPAMPGTTGTARFVLTYWDPCSGTSGFLGVATGTIDVDSPAVVLDRPAAPPGTIPSAWVRLAGGQGSVTEFDIYDARPIWTPSLEFSTGSCGIWAGIIPIGDPGGNFTGTTVESALEELADSEGGPPSGPAGGDLTGAYPDPLVVGLYGSPLLPAAPAEGDVLMFTGTSWRPLPSPVTADAWGFPVENTSGAFAGPNDVGYIDEAGEYKTTTTEFGDVAWCVVLVGGSNGDDIFVTRRGRVTVALDGNNSIGDFLYTSPTAGQGESKSYVRPELFAVALTANGAGAGGTCEALLYTGRVTKPVTSSDFIIAINAASDSDWRSTCNGAPVGAVVTYSVGLTSGSEDTIVPTTATQLAKLVLWNTTKVPAESALIDSVDTGANTITVNNAADVAGWLNAEVIVVRSQENAASPGGVFFFDLEFEDTSTVPELATGFGAYISTNDSGATNAIHYLHPWEADATSKRQTFRTQTVGVAYNVTTPMIPIIQRRFVQARNASGAGTLNASLRLLGVTEAVP
ncbi:MAG: hypothetical protein V3W44_02115 [Dehalococcoidales bacterium]